MRRKCCFYVAIKVSMICNRIGMYLIISLLFSALAVMSLLPENAFCSLRGTCRGGSGYAHNAYQNYQNRWRQKYAKNYHRLDDYEDVEYVDRLGLSEQMPQQSQESKKFAKALRPPKKPHQRSFTRSKRDSPYYSDYDDYNYDDSAYVGERDLSSLPAEHRVLPEERQGNRNPM